MAVKKEAIKEHDVINNESVEKKTINYGVVVDCYQLNVRENPSVDSKVLSVLDTGTKVKISTVKGNAYWYKVEANDIKGYCMNKYIKKV